MARLVEIKEFLERCAVNFKVIELSGVARSVNDVLKLANGAVNEDEVVKTLIVKKNGNFAGYVLRGDDRLKDSVFDRLATKDEVEKIAGVEFGAVCPILLGIPIVIDKNVMNLKRVNMGSGDLLRGLEMDLEDFFRILSDYKVEELI